MSFLLDILTLLVILAFWGWVVYVCPPVGLSPLALFPLRLPRNG